MNKRIVSTAIMSVVLLIIITACGQTNTPQTAAELLSLGEMGVRSELLGRELSSGVV